MFVKEVVHVEAGLRVSAMEKRLTSRERGVPEAGERLRLEATLLGRLAGRASPRLLGSGEDGDGPWLRTERVPFPSLAERLERGPNVDAAWMERAILAALRALATLHDAEDELGPLGLVHGDLSPRNLLVDDRAETVVIVDFELARWRERPSWADGAFRGTVAYCAPEVARGEPGTTRSDLFGLGAALLHAATGTAPRQGASLAALLALAAETPLLEAIRENVAARGPGHAAIVSCLAHEPEQRPPSARVLLERLR